MKTFYPNRIAGETLRTWKKLGAAMLDSHINFWCWLIGVCGDELRRRESLEPTEPLPANPRCEKWSAFDLAGSLMLATSLMSSTDDVAAREFMRHAAMAFSLPLMCRAGQAEKSLTKVG